MKRKKKIKKIKDAVLRIRFEIMKIERSKKKKKWRECEKFRKGKKKN